MCIVLKMLLLQTHTDSKASEPNDSNFGIAVKPYRCGDKGFCCRGIGSFLDCEVYMSMLTKWSHNILKSSRSNDERSNNNIERNTYNEQESSRSDLQNKSELSSSLKNEK